MWMGFYKGILSMKSKENGIGSFYDWFDMGFGIYIKCIWFSLLTDVFGLYKSVQYTWNGICT